MNQLSPLSIGGDMKVFDLVKQKWVPLEGTVGGDTSGNMTGNVWQQGMERNVSLDNKGVDSMGRTIVRFPAALVDINPSLS